MRVAYLCDYAEEGWPSMDLVATELPRAVEQVDPAVRVERLQPVGRSWFGTAPRNGWNPSIRERLVNRYVFYPSWLRRQPLADRVFHILDHSYAHLLDELPAARTVVTCHDLDAFRCVLNSRTSPRPWLFRRAVRRTLRGLQRAAAVVCVSEAVREELIASGIAPRERILVVPNGIHPAFTSDVPAEDESEARKLLGSHSNSRSIDLLHVGIPIERKRIDVAIRTLARLRESGSPSRLIRAGGSLPRALRELAADLRVGEHIVELPFVSAGVLAAVYRRASVVLLPSDREGFGLPLVEALASGTPVIASDIPVLNEVGGLLARYRSNADVEGWCRDIATLVARPDDERVAWKTAARAHARTFSWERAAQRLVPIYRELSSR